MKSLAVHLGLVLAFLAASGCATFQAKRQRMVAQISRGEYDLALASLEKVEKSNPTLLDLLDRGTILHLKGEYKESNVVLEKAERLIDDLYTKSLSREIGMYLVNDTTQAYAGEEFERVWVNIVRAMNYIALDDLMEGMVEIRKIDDKLQRYAMRYGGESRFLNQAFAHYLSGLMHEATGDYDDAQISYRHALEGYKTYDREFGIPTPVALAKDFLCTSKKLGFQGEYQWVKKQFHLGDCPSDHFQKKEVVFLFFLGKIAHKESRYSGIESIGGPVLKMSYPVFVTTPYDVQNVRVKVGTDLYSSELLESISKIAKKTLADRIVYVEARAFERMLLRAGASAVAGAAVAKSTKNDALGALVAALTDTALGYTEVADTRSWLSLPSQVRMVRVPLEAAASGDFVIQYLDEVGRMLYEEKQNKLAEKKSRKVFFQRRALEKNSW